MIAILLPLITMPKTELWVHKQEEGTAVYTVRKHMPNPINGFS